MDESLRNLLLEKIRAKPGIMQKELIRMHRDRAAQNTVRNRLKELEKEAKIRSRRRGKYVEYTAIDEMQTEDLDRTIRRSMDEIDKILYQIRQALEGYPYYMKVSLNDSLDWYRDRLRVAVENAKHASYDPPVSYRETRDEIEDLLEKMADDSDCKAGKKLDGVSLRIVIQLGNRNEKCRQLHEEYHKIKFRDAKQANSLRQQQNKFEKEMGALNRDLNEIHKGLEKKVVFDRTDVNLCGLASRMEAKYRSFL